MFARVLLGCGALCALAFVSRAADPKEPKDTPLKPTAVFRGSHSAIRGEEFHVITIAKEWDKLWSKHRGDTRDPLFTETSQSLEIDFETHYAVAIFTGSGERCSITSRQRGDAVVIGFGFEVFSTEGRLPDRTDHEKAKDNAAAEYVFILLPKPVKVVVVEQNREYRRNKPPDWIERAKFPAPKSNK
jgi:hypothetical protein